MIQKFKQFPEPLQRQMLMRLATALGVVLLAGILASAYHDISVIVVGVVIVTFCVGQTIWLFRLADRGRYVLIKGVCQERTITPITRRVKSALLCVVVDDQELLVKVSPRPRLKKLPPGTQMEVYIAENTSIYPKDGEHIIPNYLALKISYANVS